MVVAGGGEVAGRDPGPVRTRWSIQPGLRWLVAARLLQQAAASLASRPWQTRPRAVGSCSGEATRQWRCTATNAYLGIERPRGSSSAGSSELGGGIHGGRAPACARAEEMRQGGRERGREAWRHPGTRFEAAGHEAARGMKVGRASAMVGRALVHGRHEVISSSTWRALLCPTWSPFSAYSVQIRALAPIEKLLSSECSSTLIKGARPLGYWISI